MELAFSQWLLDARSEDNLSDEEIQRVLVDMKFAYALFMDFASDREFIAEWTQEQMADFKMCLKVM